MTNPKRAQPLPVDQHPVYFTPGRGVADPRVDAGKTQFYGALRHKLATRIGHSSAAAGWSEEVVAECLSLPVTDGMENRMLRHRLGVMVGSLPAFGVWDDDGCRGAGLMLPGAIHLMPQGSTTRTSWTANLRIVTLEFSSVLMGRLLDGRDSRDPSEQLIPRRNVPDAIAYDVACRIMSELSMPTERLYGEMLCISLAVHLLRAHGRTRIDGVKRRLSPREARRVADFIHAHLDGSLSVAALAQVAGMSDACFARAFRATFNEPPHRMVLRWRLERAARLARTKDVSLAEAAAATGFCDQAHFTNAMRRHFGKPPSALMKHALSNA